MPDSKSYTLTDLLVEAFINAPNASAPKEQTEMLKDAGQRIRKGYYSSNGNTYKGIGTVGPVSYYFDINCPKEPIRVTDTLALMLKSIMHDAWKSASMITKRPTGIEVKIERDATAYKISVTNDAPQTNPPDINKYARFMTQYKITADTIKGKTGERHSIKITIPYASIQGTAARTTPAPMPKGLQPRQTKINRNKPPAPMPGT